ncbi:MAG: recombinase family protein [Candidatus Sifarchaeia archaeon]
MKAALYGRVSKADDSQSPDNQLLRMRAYAEDRGWIVYDEYVDKASGADAHRPELDRMMNDAKARRFSIVLCVKVDRLARSVLNLYATIAQLDHKGIGFECTDQDISTSSATGKLLLTVLGGIAEFERELISERTKAGLARAKASGKTLGRPRYDISDAEILRLRSEGLSLKQIAERLGMSHQGIKKRLQMVRATKRVEN